jgi:hypothetical protein
MAQNEEPTRRATLIEITWFSPEQSGPYPLETAARLTATAPGLILRYLRLRLIESHSGEGEQLLFDDRAIYRLRLIGRLRTELGIGRQALPFVFDLIDRIEQLEHELRFLRRP